MAFDFAIRRQISDAVGLHGTKENAALKVSDTFSQQRRIIESRRPFDAAATQIGDWEGAATDQLVTGEAPEAAPSRLQKELAEVLRQRAAIWAVLRAIANSPHDLQPIFDTILDSAVHLCQAEWGALRISEETGLRLVAYKVPPALSELYSPPMLRGRDSFMGRFYGSKSPVHIPDLATHHKLNSAGEAER